MEKGVKQGKSSYPLLSMKKDQANKTNIERVYRWQPLVWEPGLNGSSIDLQLVQEWAQCSWSRVEAEGVERRWGQRWPGVSREGEGRSYHDITPLLCHYVSEQHSFSTTSEVVQGSQCGQGRSAGHQGAGGGIPLQQLGHGPLHEGATCYPSVTTQ